MKPLARPTCLALLLYGALFVLAGYHAGAPRSAHSRTVGEPAPAGVALPNPSIIRVFVVWGSSNACGSGTHFDANGQPVGPPFPNPPTPWPGTAYEWHWSGDYDPIYAEDPFPCHKDEQTGRPEPPNQDVELSRASAWPQFAFTYNELTGGQQNGDLLFVSSAALGGSEIRPTAGDPDWHPTSNELYADGIATITSAMQEAQALAASLPGDQSVVFGGVLWNQGNDLMDIPPPWTAYTDALRDLLTAFEEEVIRGPDLNLHDGRFYFINTSIRGDQDYVHNPGLKATIDSYMDLEADVCSEYAFCSMTQASVYIKEQQDACGGSTCGGWYVPGSNWVHWGYKGLEHIGQEAAEVAVAHEAGDSFTWEVGIEVVQPGEYDPIEAYHPIRLHVYKSDGNPAPGFEQGVEITPTLANPDWTADFDGGSASWTVQDWTSLSTVFLTFEFQRDLPGTDEVVSRYVYVPTSVPSYPTGTNFYRPEAGTGEADVRFEVSLQGLNQARVRAKSGFTGPFFEEVFAGSYVLPYNHDYYAAYCALRCSDELPGYFLAPVPKTGPVPTTTTQQYTFASEVDVVIPTDWGTDGTLRWDVPNLKLKFPADRRLIVEGALDATGVALTEATTGQGWGGVVFRGSSTNPNGLHGSIVEHVLGLGTTLLRGGVEVSNRTLTVDEVVDGTDVILSQLRGGTNGAIGLLATGTAAVTVSERSQVTSNAGGGIYASGGAHVTVEGQSVVELNGGGGVRADGFGTLVELKEVLVLDNAGPGVRAHALGQVAFGNASTFLKTEVKRNLGGLYATGGAGSGGSINAGTCNDGELAPCQGRTVHELFDNGELNTTRYDARTMSGSSLYAQGNAWDVTDVTDLNLLESQGSVLEVCPIYGGTCDSQGRQAGGLLRGGAAHRGDGSAPRLTDVLALVDEAERARLAGDMEAFEIAALAVVAAIDTSATEDERRAAFEATARLFTWAQPQESLAALEALAAEPGEAHPWATRALGVARASAGDYASARAAADTLLVRYAGSEHAEFGYGLAIRVAVAEGDESGAVSALLALAAEFPESEDVGALAAVIVGAFPDADLSTLEDLLGSGLRSPEDLVAASAVAATAATAAASGVAGALLDMGEVRPNPAAGAASVPFALGAEARVEAALYDVLGRRAVVLASGRYRAGRHVLTFDGSRFPSGSYVVCVVARGAQGTYTAVRRITFTR
jgi:hypothetical protein